MLVILQQRWSNS